VTKCHGECGIIVSVRRRIGDAKRTESSPERSQAKRVWVRVLTGEVVSLKGRIASGTRWGSGGAAMSLSALVGVCRLSVRSVSQMASGVMIKT